MDQETAKMIKETLRLSRDNNEMLHKMRSAQKRSAVWKFIKFLFAVSMFIGLYFFLIPYIQSVKESYNSAQDSIEKVKEFGDKLPF